MSLKLNRLKTQINSLIVSPKFANQAGVVNLRTNGRILSINKSVYKRQGTRRKLVQDAGELIAKFERLRNLHEYVELISKQFGPNNNDV